MKPEELQEKLVIMVEEHLDTFVTVWGERRNNA